MNRHPVPAIGFLLATVISGCSYDRSFMQLDSNSGVPFFGFQWAVDSGSRPSKSASRNGDHETAPSLIDLRAPSKLDQPGRDRLDLESERDDIQTVSINRRSSLLNWVQKESTRPVPRPDLMSATKSQSVPSWQALAPPTPQQRFRIDVLRSEL